MKNKGLLEVTEEDVEYLEEIQYELWKISQIKREKCFKGMLFFSRKFIERVKKCLEDEVKNES